MSLIKQKSIELDDKILIELEHNNIKYYPITHIYKDILLKSKQPASKLIKYGYNIKQFEIDFGYGTGGIQSSQCISKESLIELLKKSYIGGLTVEQKRSMNLLLDYLDMDLIDSKPRYKNIIDYKRSSEYDDFEKDCIIETLKLFGSLEWQKCTKCNKYYPLHGNFFRYNHRDNLLGTICRNCLNTDSRHMISHPDVTLTRVYRDYGNDIYTYYKDHDTINIYKHYIKNKLSSFPRILLNKEDMLIIIQYLYDSKKINKDNITVSFLREEHGLKSLTAYLTQDDIYEYLFGDHPRKHPWKYDNYKLKNLKLEEAKIILNNYLIENNLKGIDLYELDYSDILKKAGLISYYGVNVLGFVMKFYENKYAAYRFKTTSTNYWKTKENRIMALKYLIEEDMKLELEKIPLYLTITSIRSIGTTTMYTVLKNYYSSLYEWVNEVYPDVFDPKDFDINYMRNEFDSVDEQTINDILKDNFENVLYNPKHTEHTIKLLGKIPDWFVFTTTGTIIVEYFGLWAKKRGMYNTRTRDYIISSKDKMEKYKTLQGYKFLYIFPEDLDNNYEGLYNKIESIKSNKSLNKIG